MAFFSRSPWYQIAKSLQAAIMLLATTLTMPSEVILSLTQGASSQASVEKRTTQPISVKVIGVATFLMFRNYIPASQTLTAHLLAIGLGRAIGPLAAGGIFALGDPGATFFFDSALVVLAVLIALPALSIKHKVSLTHSTLDVQTVSPA